MQLWMFATPVIYPLSQVSVKWAWIIWANPVSVPVEALRICLLGRGTLEPRAIAISARVTLVLVDCRTRGLSQCGRTPWLTPYEADRRSLASFQTLPARQHRRGQPARDLGWRASAIERGRRMFWALRDVTFAVQPGEVMGLVGRNGAGKSTLLRILSRITKPTGGRAVLRGRVASLLEVGTGFHPDLTGRENIFLNGAILGMKRAEIARKFDEIVAFSGVEKFIDTPVKRYSSGMYVRLAFAVAAHLEPEILVVDEVLAVGDADFQKKCLGKMREVTSQGGRTVLFVSHNLARRADALRPGGDY